MTIEDNIFKKTKLNIDALTTYGFINDNESYLYSKVFMNHFKEDIVITKDGKVTGKIIDLNTDYEYFNFRVIDQTGEFVSKVREEYINILNDIKKHCFYELYFVSDQSNRITNKILNLYADEPQFLWDNNEHGVFRNAKNKKWYGIIMNIDKSKLDKNAKNVKIEVINLKLDPELIISLLNKDGFYKAYHMNKKYWISIILDNTIKDDEIINYICMSHKYTE